MFPRAKLAPLSDAALAVLTCPQCRAHMVEQTGDGLLYCLDCDTCGKCGLAYADDRGHSDPCAPFLTTYWPMPASAPEYKHHATRADAVAYIASKVDAGPVGYAHGFLDSPGCNVGDQWLKKEDGRVVFEAGE